MKSLRSFKIGTAEVTLIGILVIAALSQRFPQISTILALAACALVGAFALSAYYSDLKSETQAPVESLSPDVMASPTVAMASVCNWEPRQNAMWVSPAVGKAHVAKLYDDAFWSIKHVAPRRTDLFDLTHALPDRCTVRIGMVEIRLDNGHTSVKMKTSRDPDLPLRKREVVLLETPPEIVSSLDRWSVN